MGRHERRLPFHPYGKLQQRWSDGGLGMIMNDGRLILPPQPDVIVCDKECPQHLCFGDDEEYFPQGVPVTEYLEVLDCFGRTWIAYMKRDAYWTGPVLLTHEWNPPGPGRRPLNFLEAASLLGLYPTLGSVRYCSGHATCCSAELYIRPDGHMRVSCGATHRRHHWATVEGDSPYEIREFMRA